MSSYENVDRANCLRIAQCLEFAFNWGESPEGDTFWRSLKNRMVDLSKGSKPTTPLWNDKTSGLLAIIVERDQEIERQAQTIVELRRKLRIADWVNSSLPRGAP